VIRLEPLGEQTLVTLRAPVLSEIDSSVRGHGPILEALNERNSSSHFGKWVFYGETGVVALEYDLLGNHLQDDELMTAIAILARAADREDDELQRELGTGRRAFEDRS
jgi:hypothetical protein